MYLERNLNSTLNKYMSAFPAVGVTGPRQSGKSTLLQHQLLGAGYTYVTFDDAENIALLKADPKRFMLNHQHKVIFDEVQLVPELFPAVKMAIDSNRQNYGNFVLTGSNQFKLLEKITESLAGRIGLISLLPFQASELPAEVKFSSLYRGCYPELAARSYAYADIWYNSYINTYLEKDVKKIHNVGDLNSFRQLLKLLAANVSQLLNIQKLANDIGVSHTTIRRWISILEASYIIFLLPPYFNNLRKRVVKSPKVYFYDNGLATYLTGISTKQLYENGPLYGELFENYVVSEMVKNNYHFDLQQEFYFYRTSHGEEIDLVVFNNHEISLFEIKAGFTFKNSWLKTIDKLYREFQASCGTLLYQGESKVFEDNKSAKNIWEQFAIINTL